MTVISSLFFYFVDCWQHLRIVWFGAVIKNLGKHLQDWMKTDLDQIHFSLRITTNIINLLRAVERYFGGNANYTKGKGAEFMNCMNRYHPTAYLYAVSWACGRSCQGIGVEGAITVLMNVPYYLEFIIWRMRCGHGDGILERNLFILLRSVNTIAFLRVLPILHIAVCMLLPWLSGNCGDLYQHNFGVSFMVSVVDIIDKALYEELIDGEKLINENFMMVIFDGITKKLPPLQEYLGSRSRTNKAD